MWRRDSDAGAIETDMSISTDATPANASQADYWQSESGQKWVRHQAILDAVFAAVSARLIEIAGVVPGERVIDIGCGTGGLALDLAKRVGDQGEVLAIDIARPLLDRAEQRLREAGSKRIELVLADAQTFAFEPGRADLVVSRFGVMFFDDPIAAFANIAKALRPGGRIVVAAWAALSSNPWFDVPRDAAIAELGEPPPRAPNEPGPLAFADIGHVETILRAAGLQDVRGSGESLLLDAPVRVDDITSLVGEIGMAARMIRESEASRAKVEAILARVRRAFSVFATDHGVRVPSRLNFFQARKADARAATAPRR